MTTSIEKRKTVDFQGALDVVAVESIFQLICYSNMSGKLLLLNPPAKATFFFNVGNLVWGTLHTQQKQLGQRLLDSNDITRDQLAECLAVHNTEGQNPRLGNILLARGFIEQSTLQESLKAQIKDAFFHVLSWNRGSFAFISNIIVEEEIELNERIDHLLLEGIVKFDDAKRATRGAAEQPDV